MGSLEAAHFSFIISYMERMFSDGAWFLALGLLALAAAGYLLLVNWGRERLQAQARGVSSALRSFENRYRQLLSELQGFSASDPEPYGEPARQILQGTDQIGQQLFTLREQYVRIQQRLPHKPASLLQAVRVSPVLLLSLNKELKQASQDLSQLEILLGQSEQQAQALALIGWQVARHARQTATIFQALGERLENLTQHRAHGSAFEALSEKAGQTATRLAQIPEYFHSAGQESFQSQAEKTTVIQVFEILQEANQELDGIETQLQAWEVRLASVEAKSAHLRQAMASVEQSLEILPAAVERAGLQRTFEQRQAESQRLHSQASRPELEKLPAMETAFGQQLAAVEKLGGEVRHVQQGQAALERVLADLAVGMKEISDQYTALGTAKSYRILWSHTSNELASLNQLIGELGTAQSKRSPEKLEADLENANQLALGQKALVAYLAQVSNQHTELVALLEGPELSQAVLWAQNANKLLAQIRAYQSDNWPRADGAQSLGDDLRTVTERLQRLGAGRPGDGIDESQLAQSLQEAYQAGQLYQGLHVRVSAIEARLAALQQRETEARENLEGAAKTLTQVGFIINSNPFLTRVAGQGIERFQKQIEKQLIELDQRQQGTVDAKARQADGLILRIEQGLNEWLEQLSLDSLAKVKSLTASLTRLDSIAQLEDAPAAEARRLLSSVQPYAGSAYGQKERVIFPSLVMAYKERSEYHQDCSATERALQELEKPVVETYNNLQQVRQQVQDQFTAANTWLRQARAWPPVEVEIDPEAQTFGRLEADWKAVREKPIKAIALVKRLGDLRGEYQALAGRMSQLIERGNREQKDVQRLESELDNYLNAWEKLLSAYPDNPQASDDIRQLLDGADQEMYRVKTQYREGGLSYAQAVQSIQGLHRKVRLYQAVLDETHVVDVNGRVIASKDSQRTAGEW